MRKIIHIDMDCFYAQVEMRDNPEYQNIPLAVGGEGKRSVLSTCNYMARQYGVRSAMPAIKAKQLCPDLKIVHGRMQVYQEISHHIRAIFSRYTEVIEPLSLDEAFLDVSDCEQFNGSATLIAEDIRQTIWSELQLTASAGVAPNKFLAKIASDENKPNGQCVVSPNKVSAFVENLELRKIPGIGPKTSEKLAKHNIKTCADIRSLSVKKLTPLVGSFAERLFNYSFGVDNREVKVNRVRKSVGVERTFAEDLVCIDECLAKIPDLLEKIQPRLKKHQDRLIVKQGVKIKFADFTLTTMEQQSTELNEQGLKALMTSAFQRGKGKTVRLLGVFVAFAEQENSTQEEVNQQQLDFSF